MRLFLASLASLLLGMLVIGCSTVDPDECWPNTSGGFGGGGTIPIGAGVGATSSGDFLSPPPEGPLDHSGKPNPCVTPESPKDPCAGVSATPGDGATSLSCSDACRSKCPPPGTGFLWVDFKPSDFPFVTTIKDDGKDPGGGYQVAKVNLKFEKIIIPLSAKAWWCDFTIGMPLRTEFMGKIDASRAASLSIEITEAVARGMDYTLPQGVFCIEFVPKVDAAFKSKYPRLGASAVKK